MYRYVFFGMFLKALGLSVILVANPNFEVNAAQQLITAFMFFILAVAAEARGE